MSKQGYHTVRVALTHKPPNRCSVELGGGQYYTRPWLEGEKEEYVKANSRMVVVPGPAPVRTRRKRT